MRILSWSNIAEHLKTSWIVRAGFRAGRMFMYIVEDNECKWIRCPGIGSTPEVWLCLGWWSVETLRGGLYFHLASVFCSSFSLVHPAVLSLQCKPRTSITTNWKTVDGRANLASLRPLPGVFDTPGWKPQLKAMIGPFWWLKNKKKQKQTKIWMTCLGLEVLPWLLFVLFFCFWFGKVV